MAANVVLFGERGLALRGEDAALIMDSQRLLSGQRGLFAPPLPNHKHRERFFGPSADRYHGRDDAGEAADAEPGDPPCAG